MPGINFEQLRAIGEICRMFSRRLEKGAGPGVIVTELVARFPKPSPAQKNILEELKRCLRKARESVNPKPIYEEILSVVCAWGDTIEEDKVFNLLKAIAAEAG